MRRQVKHCSPYLKYYKKHIFLYLPPVFTATTVILENVTRLAITLALNLKHTLP